jgi:hypothetical protein
MEVLTPEDMDARISSARPLNSPAKAANAGSYWNIELPWKPGTFVSIMWAKLHAAQLLQRVAEAETRMIRREFEKEQERGKEITHQYSEASDERFALRGEVAQLKKRLRGRRK